MRATREDAHTGQLDLEGAALATLDLGALVFGLVEWSVLGLGAPLVIGSHGGRRRRAGGVRVGTNCEPNGRAQTNDAAVAVPLAHVHRRESADAAALRRARRRALLPAVQSATDAGLFPAAGRRGAAADDGDDLRALALGWGPRAAHRRASCRWSSGQ